MLRRVDDLRPGRLVFDSLSELRMLARDPLRYRRQILGLKQHLAERECTVLLLDDTQGDASDSHLQSIAHGVVLLQNLGRDFGINRRRLEISKMRGSKFREGFHDFSIETGGVTVYPRLVAAEHAAGIKRSVVPSGLEELDRLFDGGIDSGTSTLLRGPAGCGKSTIASLYAVTAARRGEKAAIFSFDETTSTLLKRAQGFQLDLEPHIAAERMAIQRIDPAEMSPGKFVSQVRHSVEQDGASVIILDSLNGFINAMPGEQFLMLQLHEMLSYLNQKGVAIFLTMAQSGFVGTQMASPIDVSYLADSVLLFRYFKAGGNVRQALSVVKKRGGSHERSIRELTFFR